MEGNTLTRTLTQLRAYVAEQGWHIVAEKELAYGYQLTISDHSSKVPVALYTTGKVVIQGKAGELQNKLQAWCERNSLSGKTPGQNTPGEATAAKTVQVKPVTGIARIGSDESGKGDYFGPLVTAAVYVDPTSEAALNELGIRDSKKLSDGRIRVLAQEISQRCPCKVLTYMPEVYNEIYTKTPNVNLLLASAHARIIDQLAQQSGSSRAIVDQFGDEALVRTALHKLGSRIALEQRHRAEDDTAVAAASIIARAKFVQQMHVLAEMIGIELLKGASNPKIVSLGRDIVARHGPEGLRKVAKIHFKTTENILLP